MAITDDIVKTLKDPTPLYAVAGTADLAAEKLQRVPALIEKIRAEAPERFEKIRNTDTKVFQDRVTGILEVHLATVSNRLNQVMKVLTVMSTIFLPLTVLTGMWGMNVPLPHFPGAAEVQFWWVAGLMVVLSAVMLAVFRRNRWL